MSTIAISKNPNASVNTAEKDVSKKELVSATKSHINDVRRIALWFIKKLVERADSHDKSKFEYLDEYYAAFDKAQETGDTGDEDKEFSRMTWNRLHNEEERHHQEDNEDIDLVDILEMIFDRTAAGLARTGEVEWQPFEDDVVHKAIFNTVQGIVDASQIEE